MNEPKEYQGEREAKNSNVTFPTDAKAMARLLFHCPHRVLLQEGCKTPLASLFLNQDSSIKFCERNVAGLFALIDAWIAIKREHRQWLRNERLGAYENYFTETQPWTVRNWLTSEIDLSKEAQTAKLRLQMVAPKEVLQASRVLQQQISDVRHIHNDGLTRASDMSEQARKTDEELFTHHLYMVDERTAELGRAMRKSLKLPRRDPAHWVSLIEDSAPSEEEFLSFAGAAARRPIK